MCDTLYLQGLKRCSYWVSEHQIFAKLGICRSDPTCVWSFLFFFIAVWSRDICQSKARARPALSDIHRLCGWGLSTKQNKETEGLGRVAVTRSFDIFDLSYLIFRCPFTMSALERSRRLVTTFVALILYSTSAWRLRQLNRLMNPKKQKKITLKIPYPVPLKGLF